MIRHYLVPESDDVLVVIRDFQTGIVYSKTPLSEYYKYIHFNPHWVDEKFCLGGSSYGTGNF